MIKPYEKWYKRLDIGDGKEVNLTKCPRTLLQRQCITYLGPVRINPSRLILVIKTNFNLKFWFGLVRLTERETSVPSGSRRWEISKQTKQETRGNNRRNKMDICVEHDKNIVHWSETKRSVSTLEFSLRRRYYCRR